MRTLTTAIKKSGDIGDPLPQVWSEFEMEDIAFRQGQLAIVAAGPGGGKSLLALNYAVRCGKPTLYFSADTDPYTTGVRAAALLTGHPIHNVENGFQAGGGAYAEPLNRIGEQVRWSFDRNPSIEDLAETTQAFGHLYGEYPALIVVDNLSNLYTGEDDDNKALRRSMEALNILAGESGSCVMVLHHLTGEYESGDKPPPLSALSGKVGKLPSLALTLFRAKHGDMGVCVVKNRFGPADPSGAFRTYLPIQLDKGRIG